MMLNKIFILRLRSHWKPDKSELLCEGIRILHKKEIGVSNG